jgi:hypothetical protein
MAGMGRLLVSVGIILVVVGGLFIVGSRFGLGRLPGDIRVNRGSFHVYVPLVSSLIISAGLTLLLNLAAFLFGRR